MTDRERNARAAIEGEAFERGGGGFGFGAAPFCSPLGLGNEHSIFAMLFLPHCKLSFFCLSASSLEP